MRPTTKQHFRIFDRYCRKWITALKLTNWVTTILHAAENDNELAVTRLFMENKQASITLNTNWDITDKITTEELKQTALHEVCHILLAHLVQLAESRVVAQGAIEIEEHEVIRCICLSLQELPKGKSQLVNKL